MQVYGSHSELAVKGVDTMQLLGLIGEGKEREKHDSFVYKDNTVVVEDSTELEVKASDCSEAIIPAHSLASLSSEKSCSKHEEVCQSEELALVTVYDSTGIVFCFFFL